MFSLTTRADIDRFATLSFSELLVEWGLVSLVTALVIGSLIHTFWSMRTKATQA